MNPQVSVILPVYNVEKYLEQCLDSIVEQTLSDIEIICVDDGSTDNSIKILERYAERDNRIKIIAQKNMGAGAARNTGLEASCGKNVLFLDSDDFFELDMLEQAVKKIEEYQADFVVFKSNQYHMESKQFVETPWTLQEKDIPPYMPFTYRELTDNVFKTFVGWAWDKLYRRDFILQNNLKFQEQRTSNDLLFVFSALILAERIAVVGEVLAHQRRGIKDSLSVTREKSWHCFYDALIALRNRIQEEGLFFDLEQDFINYALHFSLWNLNTLSEPTKTVLNKKLCNEWFEELGIKYKKEDYFYNKMEYKEYEEMMRKKSAFWY